MTDADMIRAIAEFDGHIVDREVAFISGSIKCDTKGRLYSDPPPYLTSLDAIVPVCEKLTDGEGESAVEFIWHLRQIAGNGDWSLIQSTARSRCEALVRTLGKWEEV